MYINKRPLNINHISNKQSYKYINNALNKQFNRSREGYYVEQKLYEKELFLSEIAFCEKEFLLESLLLFNDIELEGLDYQKRKETFQEKFERLEQQPLEFFEPNENDIDNLYLIHNFLYHGIRSYNPLVKLESIFKNRAILAGNYQNSNYYSYDDNCNNGEYISLASIDDDYNLTYQTFVMPNISLVISSECQAIKTIYLNYDEWEQIKDIETKNRYSYANNEYQVKEIIALEMIKAIGLPKEYLRQTNREHLIDIYLNDILELMNKYNIDLPIVDTSNNNRSLYLPQNHILNYMLKRNKYFTKQK